MNQQHIFYIFSGLAAAVSVAMWLDYFRRIDVFEKEKPFPLLAALAVGCCTPYLSLFLYSLIAKTGFAENGQWLNDLLYAIFGIGLNEELSKMAGVAVVLVLLRKKVNEPIDVLVYAGVTALGFSMIENFYYFNSYGIKIITSRTFYSALEHIINTSIIVYGLFRRKLFQKGRPLVNGLFGFGIAIASHGLFDFFLLDTVTGKFTVYLSIIIYLVGINFWIQMLNNANNYSGFFDYDKIHHGDRLVWRLVLWYGLTLVIAFVNNVIAADAKLAVITLVSGLISDGFLFFVVILRVSRFKFFKQKYFAVMPALPFYITRNKDEDFVFPFLNLPIKIRGESSREYLLTRYLHRKVHLFPVEDEDNVLNTVYEATVTNKYLLFDDVIVYSVDIPELMADKSSLFVLKPKTSGTITYYGSPIAGLFRISIPEGFVELKEIDYSRLEFMEWVYVRVEE